MRADDVAAVPRERWATTPVHEVVVADVASVPPTALVSDAVGAMQTADTDRIAVCEAGGYVGVVTASDLVQLDEVLEAVDGHGKGAT